MTANMSVSIAELCKATARYCRLLGAKDWAALAELLTEDMEFDLKRWESGRVADQRSL